ncbi:S-adenosyl-L-methionine-dependent methyltransferase [Echria macrotheca]|uniref:S-adenosyl-L-methionine-dependent methyltransferase n=1 Tax=Echria macrotheca TaxID=438768 RepID=A0AAJ0B967_9PEZI|nr:S-adenosyl-L-methionine-dependent methyltransferase [Echria macrotheca]
MAPDPTIPSTANSTLESSLVPLTSNHSQNKHPLCEGRRYHHYRSGRYLLPNDEVEQDREEVKHLMFLSLTDGRPFLASLSSPRKVLDLGTGTGAWALEVGDMFPDAEIIGTDLSPIQPTWTLPNVRFYVDDIEDEWVNGDDFDLVHARHVMPFLKDPGLMLQRTFEHLAPGGWAETQDIGHQVWCDDGTMSDDFAVAQFFDEITSAWGTFGADLRVGPKLGDMMRERGFVNVSTTVYHIPVGVWPHEPRDKELGVSFRIVIDMAISALCGAIANVRRWSDEEREAFADRCRRGLDQPSVHGYMKCYFVVGQKPE